jgi:class 3 adenylate cyclase
MSEPSGTRVGDAERQQVIDLLREATSDGRLTLDEFAERAGEVFGARTRHDLDRVVADLPPGVRPEPGTAATAPASTAPRATPPTAPGAPQAPEPPQAPAAPADRTPRSAGRRRFVAIMGDSRPRGRWRAAERITAFAFWGGVTIDLRGALIDSPTLDITAWAIMGGVNVIVPEGIPVELDGFVLMGGAQDYTRNARPIDGAPLIRVRARGLWGGVTAKTRRERGDRSRDRDAADPQRDYDEDEYDDRDRHGYGHGHRHRHGRAPFAVPHVPQVKVPPIPPVPLPSMSLDDLIPPILGQRQSREHSRAPRSDSDTEPRSRAQSQAGPDTDSRHDPRADPVAPAAAAAGIGGTLTVLVTDICRSTEIAARLGDQRWLGVIQAHNALVREQIHRHHGTEVKVQGDGFLITFTSARQAVLAAIAIQRAMAEYRHAHAEHQIEVRAGIHTGEVVEDQGDVIGQNVVVAVRIADVAGPGEILVSSLTKDLTEAGGDLAFDDGREASLKGVSRAWRVHGVAWH